MGTLYVAQVHPNHSSKLGASKLSVVRKTENEKQARWDDDVPVPVIMSQVGIMKATYTRHPPSLV